MTAEVPIYDIVGVGFGPSNLALAIALAEHNAGAGEPVTAHFLERQPKFGWHRGMLIDTATMQVSFLKDLVTMRNPTSGFSFLNYLHEAGRLVDFINHKNLFPLRVEFHDYFEWAAAKVDDVVSYGTEVVSVKPVYDGSEVAYFDVEASDGSALRARNLVVGTGLRPQLPEGITAGPRIWHNSELLFRVDALRGTSPKRFVVVGAGQSAAEVAALLHDEFPHAEVCAVFARYGYSPADDSSFANRIFDPEAVDQFYRAGEPVKDRLMRYHGATNYSAVDIDLIDELYRRVYREKVLGVERLRLLNVSRPVEVTDTGTAVTATVESLTTGERTVLEADAVVYATGYRPADPTPLLGELGARCSRDEEGRLRVERDYRLTTEPVLRGGIYLQGGTEHTHGITSSLLSNTAVRVGEILQSVVDRRVVAEPAGEYAVSAR
ncbi:lysine N(6)-hydroxylase/L-ornithine N(5)-oxygenase family protein [Amycolatopsis sp. SID8362]|uniref:lysine N(6)-hydroxylase/L-ornithine N(5)-oxygenase family protein n=1 Tax=Amycolatopsis sp. SID8362 TaxID=2690346 RepID=UPI001370882B|nr:lysine N(6)-hydroxylase/L-ornithine N(5)-oxygenase family protein [Amycolatopsis sp. SID8362]NBH11919.1 SidA/IucD/PvdA family monooxygenase [Amycolatopsis sp. SID8362]NED48610.1 SidA/IucD/PvdA family monooxygenase [Amycolatopsis sp. SID8362]